MARRRKTEILLALGPYIVTAETAKEVAERIRFRHYKPDELKVAKRFIAKALLPGTYFFDVYLHTAMSKDILREATPFSITAAVPWMARIDAVCVKGRKHHIIEFKDRLRHSGIGQLICYKDLYMQQYRPTEEPALHYVCERDAPELHTTLEKYNIRLWVV